jgi:hypothetical protein
VEDLIVGDSPYSKAYFGQSCFWKMFGSSTVQHQDVMAHFTSPPEKRSDSVGWVASWSFGEASAYILEVSQMEHQCFEVPLLGLDISQADRNFDSMADMISLPCMVQGPMSIIKLSYITT